MLSTVDLFIKLGCFAKIKKIASVRTPDDLN